jgi:beta-glucanase (GH16 family)
MVLSVRPDPEHPGKWLTGHVGTLGRREFTYGYFETRAKFPPLRGVLSAFWLQTTEDYIVGQAEIDVAECMGRSAVWHNVYWRLAGMGPGEFAPPVKLETDLGGPGAQAQWHTYGLDWRPDSYDFYIDGRLVATTNLGLSDRPKFLALSIKLPDYMLRLFDPEHARDYKARFKYVKVWE